MNTEQRIKYIISLYQRVCPDVKVTQDTLINNTSIKKLCQSNGGGFNRVKDWCEKKISEIEGIDPNMKKAKEQFNNCYQLMQQRSAKYGNSFKQLRLSSIIDLMAMKLDRCQNQDLDNKATEIELEDICNYAIFGLMKIRNK